MIKKWESKYSKFLEATDSINLQGKTRVEDSRKRSICVEEGYLLVDGKIVYDFLNDNFKNVAPPEDYDW